MTSKVNVISIYQLYPGSHELRICLLFSHQGRLLVLGHLIESDKVSHLIADNEGGRIGLFELAMSILLLHLDTTLGEAITYCRTRLHQVSKSCYQRRLWLF